MNIRIIKSSLIFGLLVVAGCGASNPPEVSDGHLMLDEPAVENIPEVVARVPVLPLSLIHISEPTRPKR